MSYRWKKFNFGAEYINTEKNTQIPNGSKDEFIGFYSNAIGPTTTNRVGNHFYLSHAVTEGFSYRVGIMNLKKENESAISVGPGGIVSAPIDEEYTSTYLSTRISF
jgi:hypothetical protein